MEDIRHDRCQDSTSDGSCWIDLPDDISALVNHLAVHGHLQVNDTTEQAGERVVSYQLTPKGLGLLGVVFDLLDLLTGQEEAMHVAKC